MFTGVQLCAAASPGAPPPAPLPVDFKHRKKGGQDGVKPSVLSRNQCERSRAGNLEDNSTTWSTCGRNDPNKSLIHRETGSCGNDRSTTGDASGCNREIDDVWRDWQNSIQLYLYSSCYNKRWKRKKPWIFYWQQKLPILMRTTAFKNNPLIFVQIVSVRYTKIVGSVIQIWEFLPIHPFLKQSLQKSACITLATTNCSNKCIKKHEKMYFYLLKPYIILGTPFGVLRSNIDSCA